MLEIGTILQNRYEVMKSIGQGGMGAVYLARDQRLGNTVALKETFFLDTVLLAAFEREARLLAGLRHVALPKVIDHFADNQGQFLVMEYIPGDDLHDLLEASGGAAPADEVLRWADQLLDALDYLHSQELPIIHRDIKPQNLKLTSRNQIVLLDFGLAKGTAIEMTRANSNSSIFGYTPSYAPLEQIQGSGTDARSDLYSLAATLYHLLTGMKPVDALTRASSILDGKPDPLVSAIELNAHIPAGVSEVLIRGMALNKNQRLATAAQMREMLRDAACPNRAGVVAKAPPPFSRTEVNRSDSPAALPGPSTHILASAPATSAQASERTGAHTTRTSATNLNRATPARFNGPNINQPGPGTAAKRRSATVRIADTGASSLHKVIAAGVVLALALALIVFVFTRGVRRDGANAAPVGAQKNEPATGTAQSDNSSRPAVEPSEGPPFSAPQNAPSSQSARKEEPAKSDGAIRKEEPEVKQEARQEDPKQEEPNRARAGVPAMQEPEGTKSLPRKPEEEVRSEPVRQESSRRQEPPPPHQLPPPRPYPPPPDGMPPGGMPPPGRRRP